MIPNHSKMTITLETYYERIIWKEWSNRIKILSEHKIRQLFYPNNMDILDLIVKNCIKKRREAIAHSRKFSLLPRGDSTQDERNIWTNHTANIYEFSQTIYDHMSDEFSSTAQFIEELVDMEYTRLHTLEVLMAIRIQKAEEKEAAETLLLLYKQAHQKEARKRKRESVTNNPPPLRRSNRRTAGINAPISGAKVDTILPDQNY